ncbi:hypothetical protein [Hymenobacter arizonensis]|uniref:hypothetical protein n=1 Tax=Hymenobacter arizonensis TaxID=1227077 RepID=UPI000B84A86E|nr:hypothetical protein [Hymenobacter arizonensis]
MRICAVIPATTFEAGSRLRHNPAHPAGLSSLYNFSYAFSKTNLQQGLSASITGYCVGYKL